jgi:hypothetical protein
MWTWWDGGNRSNDLASLSEEPEQVDCQYLGFNLDALNARRAGHVGSNFPKDPAGKSK